MEKTARQITEERRAKERVEGRPTREKALLERVKKTRNKEIRFDPIPYLNEKRKVNRVTIHINLNYEFKEFINYETLKTVYGGYIFEIYAKIYNQGGSKIILSGQIQDELYKYLYNNRRFRILYELWNKYNNNDKIKGTKEQEDCLNYVRVSSGGSKLNDKLYTLNYFNLVEHNGHKYGSKMLYKPISKYDLMLIKDFYTSRCGTNTYDSLVYGIE